jgi:hypothetical protein
MALTEMKNEVFDGPYIKSYATEKNLRKRLDEMKDLYPDYDDKVMVIRTPAGRWTALIRLDKTNGGYIGRYDGFMTI